jgi:hypothetical protein
MNQKMFCYGFYFLKCLYWSFSLFALLAFFSDSKFFGVYAIATLISFAAVALHWQIYNEWFDLPEPFSRLDILLAAFTLVACFVTTIGI